MTTTPAEVAPPAAVKRRVFLVEDHPVVRQGLARLIGEEPDLVVCGEADDVQGALRDITAAGC